MKAKIVIVNTADCAGLLERPERFCSEARLLSCASTDDAGCRMRGYAAELALSFALSGNGLRPPAYRYDERGKPVIDGGFISLSHSGEHAVCALADVPIGVDIEEHRSVSEAAARRILAERELRQYYSGLFPGYALKRFVMKEAYLKMTGAGVFGGMKRVFERDGQVFFDGVRRGFAFRFGDGFIGCAVTPEPREFSIETVK